MVSSIENERRGRGYCDEEYPASRIVKEINRHEVLNEAEMKQLKDFGMLLYTKGYRWGAKWKALATL
jgi:hypothetical protein